MEDARNAVRESYLRVCESGHFFTRFYDAFFARSPIAAETFAGISLPRQKEALRAALFQLVIEEHDKNSIEALCQKLSHSHGPQGHKIHPIFYMHWLDALCEALADHDSEWNDSLEQHWRAVVGELVDRICELQNPFAAN